MGVPTAHIAQDRAVEFTRATGAHFFDRRRFSASLMAALALARLEPVFPQGPDAGGATSSAPAPFGRSPRWFGFNLLEYFSTDPDWMKYFPYRNDGMFREDDFRWTSDWGFNFARLPMDYRFWTARDDSMKIDERKLEPIDRAIRLGERYGVHINIGLHRAPGYCILDSLDARVTGIRVTKEKTNLWTDSSAQDAFLHQWTVLAQRYKSIAGDHLSFNLLNEPKIFSTRDGASLQTGRGEDGGADTGDQEAGTQGAKTYMRIMQATIECIRNIDPDRQIVVDGFDVATEPLWELNIDDVIQSAHDYYPDAVTVCEAEWARGEETTALPAWPMANGPNKHAIGRDDVEARLLPWKKLGANNVPIHFGEMGCYKHTPPQVVLAWFDDALDVINEVRSGWALWNFRGPFGVLDTERRGTRFQDWHGHLLDRPLLDLLQKKMRT